MPEIPGPQKRTVARGTALCIYSFYLLIALAFLIFGVRRSGFSHPFQLASAVAVLLLSVIWLTITVRSPRPVGSRILGAHSVILLALVMLHGYV